MRRKWTMAGSAVLLLKPAILIGTVAAVDRLAHLLGFEPCLLRSLADSFSRITGLSGEDCFALLILLGMYTTFEVTRAVAGVLAGRR
jgi:hypothetical protein